MLKFYDIPVRYENNYVYSNGNPILMCQIEDFTFDNFYNKVKNEFYDIADELDALEEDTTYYILKDDKEIFGVISLHKGYTFFDCAEHDDRVIIKCGFPHLKCDIIGEK